MQTVPRELIDLAQRAAQLSRPILRRYFRARLDEVLGVEGPVLAVLHVEQGVAHPHDYVALHSAESRETFRQALRARRAAAG